MKTPEDEDGEFEVDTLSAVWTEASEALERCDVLCWYRLFRQMSLAAAL